MLRLLILGLVAFSGSFAHAYGMYTCYSVDGAKKAYYGRNALFQQAKYNAIIGCQLYSHVQSCRLTQCKFTPY